MLTPTQAKVLAFIRTTIDSTGMPPTRREIGNHFGFVSANAAEEHLRALERRGAVVLIRGVARGIRIVEKSVTDAPADEQWDEICRDADRYRWLREQKWQGLNPAEIDCLVDSRRAQ